MDFNENPNGSTSKRQENGDKGSDRPHKKARYAWQVKGKYHLKNDESRESCDLDKTAFGDDSSSDTASTSKPLDTATTEQNLEILGDYLLKRDFNSLNPTVSNTELVTDTNSSTHSENESLLQTSKTHSDNQTSELKEETKVPVSLVTQSRAAKEDLCLARWQARQIAKGFVDNTINRVLDSWLMTPLPENLERSRNFALDVVEFINNLPGSNTIENEGILMAISTHGLQNTSERSPNSTYITAAEKNGNLHQENILQTFESDTEIEESSVTINNVVPVWEEIQKPCSCSHTVKNTMVNGDIKPLLPFHKRDIATPNLVSNNNGENSKIKSRLETECSETANTGSKDDKNVENFFDEGNGFDDSFDFLDAAVSFAIQDKGLTSLGNG